MSGRKSDTKSGLVVNSSATHSISSDLATIGIRANGSEIGVGASGTVNINKIGGQTNAKVENTDLTASKTDAFVNSSDYTNNGSFIGNAAVSGSVAIGMLWNENKVDRQTNSLVDGGTYNVKNLDVKADARQGISNLNIAVGVSFGGGGQKFAAASGDNVVRNKLESVTTAKIRNATVNHEGNVDVNAYHKDIAYATNIGAGIAVESGGALGATFDLGYGLMRENSRVDAEIYKSTLTSQSGAVNVYGENQSKLTGAFGTMGVAAHIGNPGASLAGAVGINNNYIQNVVNAGIVASKVTAGGVEVNAKNQSEVKADGGVAAVSINISQAFLASLGASVAVTNATFDNKISAEIDGSTIEAGNVTVKAEDNHKTDETVVSAVLSTGLGAGVNRMSVTTNSGLANLEENRLGKAVGSNDLVMKPENASKSNSDSDVEKLTAEFGDEERFLNKNSIANLLSGVKSDSSARADITGILTKRDKATVNYNNSLGSGVFANVINQSNITARDKISIKSQRRKRHRRGNDFQFQTQCDGEH